MESFIRIKGGNYVPVFDCVHFCLLYDSLGKLGANMLIKNCKYIHANR